MAKANKFGLFGGVFTPSILTILGVIMYLRLPWIVGQAGLWATLGIILVAHLISGSTGLSVSSIATDKKVETGGTYYIISRSLGLPIGGTLGWALFVGLSFSVSLYLIGFAEVFLGYFSFEVNLTNIRIAGSIILLLVTILTLISTSLAIKTQFIILTVMAVSLLSVFLGRHEFSPSVPQLSAIPESLPWITLFAIFFPAVTGFEAGVSMSGDLKDPRKAIPVGTISAILVGLIVYVGLAVFFSFTVTSDLLVNDPNVLFKISWIPQLVIAGILGATLSSALGSILAAPRIMQAVAKDRIAPSFFGKGFGASNEPRNALLLTFIIAQAGILIGELNVIARIVTIFFIITYGFLNITYTVESWASSDFRPSFKISRIVSIAGALACTIVMIQLDILAMIVATIVLLTLFFYLKNKELKLHSGDTRSGIWLSLVKTGLLILSKTKTNSRNWRPNVILFSGGTGSRPYLIELGKALVGKLGVFTNFELVENPDENLLFEKTAMVSSETFGEHTDIITRRYVCSNIYDGIGMISKVYGFAGFEPNTILMGWAKKSDDPEKFKDLLVTLSKLDYNLTFLNFDKESCFGKYNRIDFWWSGKGRNLALALHLIRFITVTPKWRNAEIRIFVINSQSKYTERLYAILGQVINNYRIIAGVKVITNIEKLSENDIIKSESYNSDLTIIEIPEFITSESEKVICYANELTGNLRSSLLIHASSDFEEVNVVTEIPSTIIEKSSDLSVTKPIPTILNKIKLSKTDIINNEVNNLAQLFEKQTGELLEDTFSAIKQNREDFLNRINRLTETTLEKLFITDETKSQQEKDWKYLKILNDFSSLSQNLMEGFKDDCLLKEKDYLIKGFTRYISETKNTINTLPQYIRLMFGKEDYRQLKPGNLTKLINKILKIAWITVSGGKTSYRIRVQPAATYFLYYKRLEYLRQFYEKYTAQGLTSFAGIREYLTCTNEFLQKVSSRILSDDEVSTEKEKISAMINNLRSENQDYIYAQGIWLTDEIIHDLEKFGKIIESPQANNLSRKFKSFNKKSVVLEGMLSAFPDLWFRFMVNHTNKTYLDLIYLSLKNQVTILIENACNDVEILIEENIYKKLKLFESSVKSIDTKGDLPPDQQVDFSQKSISQPYVHDIFNKVIRDIHKSVDELPESIDITGDELLDNVQFNKLETIVEFVVSVRKTADFYISNELSDQLKKQTFKLDQQLTLSIANIKDIIRLANFNFENRNNTFNDESENGIRDNQEKALIETLLTNIATEETKLRELTEQLRKNFKKALKNAFEPLSSSIIIKTSSSLKRKIRDTDKQQVSNQFQLNIRALTNKITNQYVKLLYSQNEGFLWAERIEQSRELALLYPGSTVKSVLEKISPDKTVMQQLPFYYTSLFSGSSSIGEDFWIGMEEETEKGSLAIKQFLKGTSGILIISGERSSGKSSLSKHLANLHFKKQNIFNIRAPRLSIADTTLFEKTLLNCLKGKNSLKDSMDDLPAECVIIINDLELWWERKPSGTQVVEKIISLIRDYGKKVLFIINLNQHSLKIINQLTSLNSWAIDLVLCRPLDARELKELIMVRHKSGGMSFVLNGKNEDEMTNRDYARLFNRIFKLSSGNPGYAINLWLTGIRSISGTILHMDYPFNKGISFHEKLPQEEIIFILQFILHRRFSVKSLSEILQNDFENTEKTVRILCNKGILIEKFPQVYSLNPALEIHLVKKLKSLELL